MRRRPTREQILNTDDRPEKVRRMDGRKGRKPKWNVSANDVELAVAVDVEKERRRHSIPRNKARTPASIFQGVAAARGISERSSRAFYAKHRKDAQTWATILESIPAHRRHFAEMVALYGEGFGAMPSAWCDLIYAMRDSLMPTDVAAFDDKVRAIICQKLE